jgi:hypothetical protein
MKYIISLLAVIIVVPATFNVSKPTASRDLEELVRKGILKKIGITGKGTYYIINKGIIKGSYGSYHLNQYASYISDFNVRNSNKPIIRRNTR